MDYDIIGKLIITENVINKIMKECGIENATCIFRGKDYFLSVLKVKKDGFDLEIKNLQKPMKIEDIVQMVLTIDGKRYFITLQVQNMKMSDGRLIIETKIVGNRCLEAQERLDMVFENLKNLDLRKSMRIDIKDEILQEFNIITKIKITLLMKEYTAYIKNISGDGINLLTTKNFMDENSNIINLKINFTNPAESMNIKGEVLRKGVINISGTEFVEAGIKIESNIYLNKRIMDYFKKRESLSLTLT